MKKILIIMIILTNIINAAVIEFNGNFIKVQFNYYGQFITEEIPLSTISSVIHIKYKENKKPSTQGEYGEEGYLDKLNGYAITYYSYYGSQGALKAFEISKESYDNVRKKLGLSK